MIYLASFDLYVISWHHRSVTQQDLTAYSQWVFEQSFAECKKGPLEPGFWMRIGEEMKFHKFGSMGHLLNSGEGKAFLFAATRTYVEKNQASAAFIVTEAWEFVAGEKAKELSQEQFRAKQDFGFKQLTREGYGKVAQSIIVLATSPEHFCIYTRRFEEIIMNGQRKLVFFGEPNVNSGPLDKFSGRAKMFGPITEHEVRTNYEQIMKQTNQ